jgi:hypothetical protein
VTASATAPEVSILEPTGGGHSGTIDVRWSGSDPDPGTEIRFNVAYSPDDGGSWQPLLFATTDTSYRLDTAQYESCERCRIRVIADDGFYTAEARSAPFEAINPPAVTSVWPRAGSRDAGPYVELAATFRNAMDGDTIDAETFTLQDSDGRPVGGEVCLEPSAQRAVFTADEGLEYGRTYTATLAGSISDVWEQQLGADYVWSFQVERSALGACTGDCNDDGGVTIDEILTGVSIALGVSEIRCDAFDFNADGAVTIDELLTAVHYALTACPVSALVIEPTAGTRTPATQTPTATFAVSPSATATGAPSPAPTPTAFVPTDTPTLRLSPTPTPSPTPAGLRVYCDTLSVPLAIPDDDPIGVSNHIVITDGHVIKDLNLRLEIRHDWVGDLVVLLRHLDSLRGALVIDRPGRPALPFGCGGHDVDCVLDDEATRPIQNECAPDIPTMAGYLVPCELLSIFDGDDLSGTWRLEVSDEGEGGTGELVRWCLEVE